MTSSKEKMWPQPDIPEPPGTPDPIPEWLGNRLRTMFSEVMDEPVPDEFKELLNQLEAREKGRAT